MLDIEQVDPDRAGEQRHGELHQQEALEAHQSPHQCHRGHDTDIGPVHTGPLPLPAARDIERESVLEHELPRRADDQQYQWVAVDPIEQPLGARQCEILVDRECVDVAEIAPFEVAGGCVMNCVGLAPVGVGNQRDHAENGAGNAVGAARTEEGAVAAVVLQHEESHDHHRGWRGQQEGQPVPDRKAPDHGGPAGREQRRSTCELPDAGPEDRTPVRCQDGVPVDRCGCRILHGLGCHRRSCLRGAPETARKLATSLRGRCPSTSRVGRAPAFGARSPSASRPRRGGHSSSRSECCCCS